jgi:hypothetical protein
VTTADAVERELQAGEELTEQFDLNRQYDLTVPGEYTIVMKRRVPRQGWEQGHTWAASNPVILVVTGPPPEDGASRDLAPAAVRMEVW